MESLTRYIANVGSALTVLLNTLLGGEVESLCSRLHSSDLPLAKLINRFSPGHTERSARYWRK